MQCNKFRVSNTPHAAPWGRGSEGWRQRRLYCFRGGSIVSEKALLFQRENVHLTNVRFLGDRFIFGFVAADCECVLISCHGHTDGWCIYSTPLCAVTTTKIEKKNLKNNLRRIVSQWCRSTPASASRIESCIWILWFCTFGREENLMQCEKETSCRHCGLVGWSACLVNTKSFVQAPAVTKKNLKKKIKPRQWQHFCFCLFCVAKY